MKNKQLIIKGAVEMDAEFHCGQGISTKYRIQALCTDSSELRRKETG